MKLTLADLTQTGLSISDVHLSTDSGKTLSGKTESLSSFGLQGETATVFLTFRSVTAVKPVSVESALCLRAFTDKYVLAGSL